MIKSDIILPVVFLLSLSFIGLGVPLFGHLMVLICLVRFVFINKYDFLIALTILITVNGFYDFEVDFPFKLYDLVILCCPLAAFYYSTRNRSVLKIVIATLFFLLGLSIFMVLSEERFDIQFRTARQYICIFYFIIPLIIFRGNHFSILYFCKRATVFIVIICLMYIADGLILHENLFLPGVNGATSQWNNLTFDLHLGIKRIYPSGLYILFLFLFIRRYCTIPLSVLLILGLALIVSQTFSFILGIACTIFIFSTISSRIKLAFFGVIIFFSGILIEKNANIDLRIGQFSKQVSSLNKEHIDFAQFGSQRGGQVIPNLVKLRDDNRLLTGVGFLHNELSRSGKFMVDSYFNKEPDVMGIVEVTQISTLIHIGILGFLFLHTYFFGLYFLLPKSSPRKVYLATVILFSLFGIGGFSGLNGYPTIIWLGLCIGVVILSYRQTAFEDKLIRSLSHFTNFQMAPLIAKGSSYS